jgi:hypothetical protein
VGTAGRARGNLPAAEQLRGQGPRRARARRARRAGARGNRRRPVRIEQWRRELRADRSPQRQRQGPHGVDLERPAYRARPTAPGT